MKYTRRRWRPSRRHRTRKGMSGGDLRTSYGTLTLLKGMRLYHACLNKICSLPEKPVLFLTLHPSEWYMEGAHIAVIELQRDVSLLFMIKTIRNMRILSALNDFLGTPNSNLAKMNYEQIKTWLPHFKKEDLDGWITSIENKTTIEFAVVNNPETLRVVECLPIRYNWSNSTYNNDMQIVPKNWGTVYSVSSKPVKFRIHSRFKPIIEKYMQNVAEEDPMGTAFSVLLGSAEITYIDGPTQPIRW